MLNHYERKMSAKKFRIASISETDSWGAGLSALKLHKAFLGAGHYSKLYVNRKFSSCPDVVEIPSQKTVVAEPFEIGQYRSTSSDVPMTTGLSAKCPEFLERVWDQSDVILLRWASVAVSDFQIGKWSRRNKPLVWCLSDMAPITGGCHYSLGCDRYTESCNPCHLIEEKFPYSPSVVLHRRERLWRKITIVSPSEWLGRLSKLSSVSREFNIEIIRTGVELDVFQPYSQDLCREKLGIPKSKKVLLYGAASVNDSRKGARYIPDVLKALDKKYLPFDDFVVLVTGSEAEALSDLPANVIKLGHISDRSEMAKAYSAADATLLPYTEDNLPNQCLESIACGTPVAAFEVGGFPDVVHSGITGALAKPFEVESLAKAAAEIMAAKTLRVKSRAWAVKNLDIKVQADKYIELFTELCKSKEELSEPK